MKVSYLRLWKLLLDKSMKRIDLAKAAGISSTTLAKLGRDEYISMESMSKICRTLHCRIQDIMEFVEYTD